MNDEKLIELVQDYPVLYDKYTDSNYKYSIWKQNRNRIKRRYLLVITGIYCSKLPGPAINGSTSSIVIGVFTCFFALIGGISINLHQLPLTFLALLIFACLFGVQIVIAVRNLLTTNDSVIRSYLRNMYFVKSQNEEDYRTRLIHDYYQCCGYYGPDSDDVIIKDQIYISKGEGKPELRNMTILIPECCEKYVMVCTKFDAYKDNCLDKIIKEHANWSQIIGVFLIITSLMVLVTIAFISNNMKDHFDSFNWLNNQRT